MQRGISGSMCAISTSAPSSSRSGGGQWFSFSSLRTGVRCSGGRPGEGDDGGVGLDDGDNAGRIGGIHPPRGSPLATGEKVRAGDGERVGAR